ncbi:AIM24 family protein [Fodinicola feengrottensis]|uniref:hypothetical protein n=1 Tax=Fodinicola feengrottensis TaxID=435914 RepID=UPI002442F97A|nr:hypothetical protein [Fodinicola feengrottensis]
MTYPPQGYPPQGGMPGLPPPPMPMPGAPMPGMPGMPPMGGGMPGPLGFGGQGSNTLLGNQPNPSTDAFVLQNGKMLKVTLGQQSGMTECYSRAGGMVAYQGGISFDGNHSHLGPLLFRAVVRRNARPDEMPWFWHGLPREPGPGRAHPQPDR